jgi:TatD DNase family protein
MLLTDTHCHLDFNKFDADRQEVIKRAKTAGVVRMLVPGLDHGSSREVIQLSESDDSIYAAVGFHPTKLEEFSSQTFTEIQELAKHPKVVAIGEIGLDYYWVKEEQKRKLQQDALKQQLSLATLIDKPVIIHMREEKDSWFGKASEDLLGILMEWHKRLMEGNHPLAERPGVLHSYNGTVETAQTAIKLGFFIGVTGPVTYKNAEEKQNIIHQLPLDRLLIETDSPFMPPVPHRGKRNEPAFVYEIADKIAEVKSKKLEEVATVTTANATRLFLW